MNAKKAKALRKLVRNALSTQPELFKGEHFIENESKRKVIQVEDLDEDGKVVTKKVAISPGQLTLNPTTARGLYTTLKNAAERDEQSKK